MSKRIRVVVVDDHEMVRRGLTSFITSIDDLELAGEASNGLEAIQICQQVNPDVVLMDLVMAVMDGVTAIRKLRQLQPRLPIIALTSAADAATVTAAMQAGATSYLLKNVDTDQLALAIHAAYRGERVLAPEATQALITAATRPASAHYNLSEREREVLHHMIEGLTNSEIADRMYISRSTVKFHVSSLLAKLNATTRAEAIAIALKNGLIN